jgi:hypothetical protein
MPLTAKKRRSIHAAESKLLRSFAGVLLRKTPNEGIWQLLEAAKYLQEAL